MSGGNWPAVGRAMRERMTEQGITADELAQKSRVSVRTIEYLLAIGDGQPYTPDGPDILLKLDAIERKLDRLCSYLLPDSWLTT